MEAEPKRAYGEAVGQEPGAHSASTLQKKGGRCRARHPTGPRCLQIPPTLTHCQLRCESCSSPAKAPGSQAKSQSSEAQNQTPLSWQASCELLGSEMGLIRSLGGAARWGVYVPNTAN